MNCSKNLVVHLCFFVLISAVIFMSISSKENSVKENDSSTVLPTKIEGVYEKTFDGYGDKRLSITFYESNFIKDFYFEEELVRQCKGNYKRFLQNKSDLRISSFRRAKTS